MYSNDQIEKLSPNKHYLILFFKHTLTSDLIYNFISLLLQWDPSAACGSQRGLENC